MLCGLAGVLVLTGLIGPVGEANAASVRGQPYSEATHAALVNEPWTGNTWLGLKWTSGVSEVTGTAPSSTSGLSISYVESQLAPGGDFEGWRYATYAEVTTLLTVGFGLPAGVSSVFFSPHPHLPAVAAFSDTMGYLYRPEMPGMFANGIPVYLYGTTGIIPNSAGSGPVRFDAAQSQWSGHPWDVFIETAGVSITGAEALSWTGHFLVLAEEPDPCDGASVPGCCTDASACDDANPCTDDTCPTPGGACAFVPTASGSACEDGIACTAGTECDGAGVCGQSEDSACNDGHPCTNDVCEPTSGCSHDASAAGCSPACATGPDINGNGVVNVADTVCATLLSLWDLGGQMGSHPGCLVGPSSVANIDCSAFIDIADVQLHLSIVLGGGLPASIDANSNGCADACE